MIAAIAAGLAFACTPVAVWDGDGPIWCAEGPRVRLAGIAAREHDGSCRRGQPCPTASAERSRDRLVQLLGAPIGTTRDGHVTVVGPALACKSLGPDVHGRTVAWCRSADAGDLSCALVKDKVALRWRRYSGEQVCRS